MGTSKSYLLSFTRSPLTGVSPVFLAHGVWVFSESLFEVVSPDAAQQFKLTVLIKQSSVTVLSIEAAVVAVVILFNDMGDFHPIDYLLNMGM